MNYTALYRKFRPASFSEMVGQEHITKTLKNQIVAGRVGHAYLFNGGRGTGKTSAAKILARAVNCLNPKDGEPCNECEICKEALNGSLTDIVEMDAASNNSVEDVRQIREEVNFLPTKAKYRVYIIDEVHMLSTGAFNALLKTLEEPPEHVKFILATTEPQKLPATILSRCQRFDFKQISNEDIIKRLNVVCDEMKIEITKEALNIIAVLAEGGMRDALSILERCLQDGDTKINEEKIKDLVGIPKIEHINRIVSAILDNEIDDSIKITNALQVINEVIAEGKDIQNFLWELIRYVKDVLIYKSSQKLDIYSEDEIAEIKKLADKTDRDVLLEIIKKLSELESNIKYSSQKQLLLEVTIIILCKNNWSKATSKISSVNLANAPSQEWTEKIEEEMKKQRIEMQEIKEKLYKYEQNTLNTNNIIKNIGDKPTDIEANKQPVVKNKSIPKQNLKKQEVNINIDNINPEGTLEIWPKIVSELRDAGKIMLYTNLINSVAKKQNDMVIIIEFPQGLTPFGKTILEKSENITELEKRISIECGKPMKIKYLYETTKKVDTNKSNTIESLAQDMDIPFNIVD